MGQEFEGIIARVEYRAAGLVAQSKPLNVIRPYGITIAGSPAFRSTIQRGLWNLMKQSQHARELIIELLDICKRKSESLLIFGHTENIVDLGASSFGEYFGVNIRSSHFDNLNGRTDKLIIGPTIETTLTHEFMHLKQRWLDDINRNTYCTDDSNRKIKFSEVGAIKSENIARVQMELSIRHYYNGVNVFRKKMGTKLVSYDTNPFDDKQVDSVTALVVDPNEPRSESAFIAYHTAAARNRKWTDADLEAWKSGYTITEARLLTSKYDNATSFNDSEYIPQRPARGEKEFYIMKK
jgi:hypothetical protein